MQVKHTCNCRAPSLGKSSAGARTSPSGALTTELHTNTTTAAILARTHMQTLLDHLDHAVLRVLTLPAALHIYVRTLHATQRCGTAGKAHPACLARMLCPQHAIAPDCNHTHATTASCVNMRCDATSCICQTLLDRFESPGCHRTAHIVQPASAVALQRLGCVNKPPPCRG